MVEGTPFLLRACGSPSTIPLVEGGRKLRKQPERITDSTHGGGANEMAVLEHAATPHECVHTVSLDYHSRGIPLRCQVATDDEPPSPVRVTTDHPHFPVDEMDRPAAVPFRVRSRCGMQILAPAKEGSGAFDAAPSSAVAGEPTRHDPMAKQVARVLMLTVASRSSTELFKSKSERPAPPTATIVVKKECCRQAMTNICR